MVIITFSAIGQLNQIKKHERTKHSKENGDDDPSCRECYPPGLSTQSNEYKNFIK
jgi:hypothetical protein